MRSTFFLELPSNPATRALERLLSRLRGGFKSQIGICGNRAAIIICYTFFQILHPNWLEILRHLRGFLAHGIQDSVATLNQINLHLQYQDR
jgi:hypothetical protein